MPNEIRAEFKAEDHYTPNVKKIRKETQKFKKDVDVVDKTVKTAGQAANKVIAETTKGVQQETNAIDNLGKAVDNCQGKMKPQKGGNSVPGIGEDDIPGIGEDTIPSQGNQFFPPMAKAAFSVAAAGVAAKKAWSFTWDSANTAAIQATQKTTMQALLNHKKAGAALYDYVSAYAKVSALGREDIANAVSSYVTYTKRADLLERMIKMTERLYAKDPTQGAQGAAFAMKELLSGDTMSIKSRYNMTGISGKQIRDFAAQGDIEGMLDYIDVMFNKFGATQEVVDANFQNLTTQTNIFTSNFKTAIGESATPAMETLAGMMRRLNADMDAGKFQPFFSLVTNGTQLIAAGVAWVGDNLNIILPIVAGVTTAFVVYKGVQMAATATTMILSAATNLMTGNFLGAAAAVAGLVGGLAAFSAINKKIDVKTGMDLESAKQAYASFENELPSISANVPIPTEISNTAPIKVKGEVEIEEESLRYLLDIQGQHWLAHFTHNTLAPQNIFNGTVIRETMDFDEFTQKTIDSLSDAIAFTANG